MPPKTRAKKFYPQEKWIGLETNPTARRIVKDSNAFSAQVVDELAAEIKNFRGPRLSIRHSESFDPITKHENEPEKGKPVYAETIMI